MGKRFSLFIAQRLRNTQSQTFSKNVTKIGIGTIALGLSLLIISFAVLRGFQQNIYNKIYQYNGEIQISLFVDQKTTAPEFFDNNQEFIKKLGQNPNIERIEEVVESPSLLISNESMQGIILSSYDEKTFPEWKKKEGIYLSKNLSNILKAKIKDKIIVYFIGDRPIPRKLIYENSFKTDLEEIDNNLAFAPKTWIRKALKIEDNKISSLKIYLKKNINSKEFIASNSELIPPNYSIRDMEEIYPGLFDWMKLLDTNILILISLLIVVAGFNIVATLYILMIERIPMIGILKSMGANQSQLKNIFWWNGGFILIRGIILGNIIGLGLCFIQSEFELIPLNESIYYMSFVPISWSINTLILINLFTILFVILIALIPTRYLDKLNPLEAINFKA
ncbi:MAG: hypothetical protein RIR51_1019 [Bacteroidota bacterium]|jgi:lipoprotein-releasing system permease protein